MRKISLAIALLSFAPAAALAKPPKEPERPDRGLDVANPYNYETNPTWSDAPAEGMRDLLVDDAAAFLHALAPVAPIEGASGKGNLVLINQASGWAKLLVNGQELGVAGPYGQVTLYGLKAGQYDVSYILTSGNTATERVSTCGSCTAADWPFEK